MRFARLKGADASVVTPRRHEPVEWHLTPSWCPGIYQTGNPHPRCGTEGSLAAKENPMSLLISEFRWWILVNETTGFHWNVMLI